LATSVIRTSDVKTAVERKDLWYALTQSYSENFEYYAGVYLDANIMEGYRKYIYGYTNLGRDIPDNLVIVAPTIEEAEEVGKRMGEAIGLSFVACCVVGREGILKKPIYQFNSDWKIKKAYARKLFTSLGLGRFFEDLEEKMANDIANRKMSKVKTDLGFTDPETRVAIKEALREPLLGLLKEFSKFPAYQRFINININDLHKSHGEFVELMKKVISFYDTRECDKSLEKGYDLDVKNWKTEDRGIVEVASSVRIIRLVHFSSFVEAPMNIGGDSVEISNQNTNQQIPQGATQQPGNQAKPQQPQQPQQPQNTPETQQENQKDLEDFSEFYQDGVDCEDCKQFIYDFNMSQDNPLIVEVYADQIVESAEIESGSGKKEKQVGKLKSAADIIINVIKTHGNGRKYSQLLLSMMIWYILSH